MKCCCQKHWLPIVSMSRRRMSVANMARLVLLFFFCCRVVLGKRCEEIKIDSCLNLEYNMTSYPNLLGHETQDAARQEMGSLLPYLDTDCSQSYLSFLCLLYAPPCTVLGYSIPPCRDACTTVQSKCFEIFRRYGLESIDSFACEGLSVEGESLCLPGVPLPAATSPSRITRSAGTTDKTLAFRVRYRTVCFRYRRNEKRKKMIKAAAAASTTQLDEICEGVCTVAREPEITCEGVTGLIMHWRTNLTTQSVSKEMKRELNNRISTRKIMLLNMASFYRTPFGFPKVNKFGQMVRIVTI